MTPAPARRRSRARSVRALFRPARARGRRRDARSLHRRTGDADFTEAPVPVVRFQSEHPGLAAPPTSRTTSLRSAARRRWWGSSGRMRRRRGSREQLDAAGVGTDGLVEDPGGRRPRNKGRHRTQPAGGAHRLRARWRCRGDLERALVGRSRSSAARRERAARVGLSEGRDHPRGLRGVLAWRRSAATGGTADRRSEDPASRLLRGRDADHAEPSRSRSGHAPAVSGPTRTRARRRTTSAARAVRAVLITRGEHGMWLSEPGARDRFRRWRAKCRT